MTGIRESWVNLPIGGPTEENRVQDVRGIQGRKARAIHLYGESQAVALNALECEIDAYEGKYRLAECVEVYLGPEELDRLAEQCKRHAERIRANQREQMEH